MTRSKLGNEFCGIFCCIYGKCFRNGKQGCGESGDRELFAGALEKHQFESPFIKLFVCRSVFNV